MNKAERCRRALRGLKAGFQKTRLISKRLRGKTLDLTQLGIIKRKKKSDIVDIVLHKPSKHNRPTKALSQPVKIEKAKVVSLPKVSSVPVTP